MSEPLFWENDRIRTCDLRLLRQLHQMEPSSIRALAKALGRDYKNVHRDVTELLRLGLIEKNEAGRILVPWDEIDARLDLSA